MKKFAILFLITALIFAVIPDNLGYQGKITDADGVGISGLFDMTFRIFDSELGGTALWSESYTSGSEITIDKGLFAVQLGSVTPIDLDFDGQYYLEIEIDGDIMTPRQKLGSSAYAFRAKYADNITGVLPAAGFIRMKANDGTWLTDSVTLVAGANIDILEDGDSLVFSVTGELGGTDSDWTVDGDNQYSAITGNVGIGTATPTQKLEISSSVADINAIQAIASGDNAFGVYAKGSDAAVFAAIDDETDSNYVYLAGPDNALYANAQDEGEFAGYFDGYIAVQGKAGIDQDSPIDHLHIGNSSTLDDRFMRIESGAGQKSGIKFQGDTDAIYHIAHDDATGQLDIGFNETNFLSMTEASFDLLGDMNINRSAYITDSLFIGEIPLENYGDTVLISRAGHVHKTTLSSSINGNAVTISMLPDQSGDWVCDGFDDNQQINEAIDYLEGIGGGEIYIKSGVYKIVMDCNIQGDNITIRGAGPGTVLTNWGGGMQGCITADNFISDTLENIHLENMRFSTVIPNNRGIIMREVRNSSIENCWFDDFTGSSSAYGVSLNGCCRVDVSNLKCESNYYGVGIANSKKCRISNSSFNHNQTSAIKVSSCSECIISENNICETSVIGMSIDSSENCIVKANTITLSGHNGLALSEAYDNIISSNSVFDNGLTLSTAGILIADNSSRNIIEANRSYGSNQSLGINILSIGCQKNTVQSNFLAGNINPYNDGGSHTKDWGPGSTGAMQDDGANYW